MFSVLWMPPRQPHPHPVLIAGVSLGCSLSVSSHTYLYLHAIYRSANLKREEKADRKDDAKKGEDGSGEKSEDQDDQKPGSSERSRATKSGS